MGRPSLDQHRAPRPRRACLARGALRVPPARLRGRPLAQPAAEDRRVRRLPLHRPPLPVFDSQVGRLNTGELDIFVGPDFLITLPNVPLPPVEYLFERCRSSEQAREELFSKGSGCLLYKVVDSSFDYCFPMLRKMGNKLDRLEEDIFEGRSQEVVRDISNVKQEIINFRKIIRPERPVLRDLERTKQRYMAEDLEIYFDDIIDASERIWDMLENYKE